MKVYFHASVGQKPKYGEYYLRIVEVLKKLGYAVNAKHALKHSWNEMVEQDLKESLNVEYEKSLHRIREADLCVFEISYPSSVVVGHFLTRALQFNKPVLALHHEKAYNTLLKGYELERFRLAAYSHDDLERVVTFEMSELIRMPDQRFTMLLPGKLIGYLDNLAEKGMNRSEYIRELIVTDMKNRGEE